MNEPFTALTCIDRLGQGLARLVTRRMPSAVRSDEEGTVRVVAPRPTVAYLLDDALDPIRAHAGNSASSTTTCCSAAACRSKWSALA